MFKQGFILAGLLALVVLPAAAQTEQQAATLETPGTTRTLTLPPHTAGAPVISLGPAQDPVTGKHVEGLAFIHYKRAYTHRAGHTKSGAGGSTCYSVLSRGARWKTVEPWVLNAANSEGLSETFLFDNQSANLAKWETAAGTQIFGDGTVTSEILMADTSTPDGSNEIYFGSVGNPDTIAVTIVWGIFSGPPTQRQLVEWDQVYNETDFDWSGSGAAGKMDFENVSTHEDGHAAGLGHPEDACAEETMFRFADFGETKKRDLHTGDVAGMSALY